VYLLSSGLLSTFYLYSLEIEVDIIHDGLIKGAVHGFAETWGNHCTPGRSLV